MIHQAFEEGLSVHLSTIIVLNLCIVLHVLKLQSFNHKTKHLNVILLRQTEGIYGVMTDIYKPLV